MPEVLETSIVTPFLLSHTFSLSLSLFYPLTFPHHYQRESLPHRRPSGCAAAIRGLFSLHTLLSSTPYLFWTPIPLRDLTFFHAPVLVFRPIRWGHDDRYLMYFGTQKKAGAKTPPQAAERKQRGAPLRSNNKPQKNDDEKRNHKDKWSAKRPNKPNNTNI